MLDIKWPFPTHMVKILRCFDDYFNVFYSKDFPGQKKAERLFQIIIVLFGVTF